MGDKITLVIPLGNNNNNNKKQNKQTWTERKITLKSDVDPLISFKLYILIATAKFNILMSVFTTLVFIQGHSGRK